MSEIQYPEDPPSAFASETPSTATADAPLRRRQGSAQAEVTPLEAALVRACVAIAVWLGY